MTIKFILRKKIKGCKYICVYVPQGFILTLENENIIVREKNEVGYPFKWIFSKKDLKAIKFEV